MTSFQGLLIAIAVIAMLASAAAFVIAYRSGPDWRTSLDRRARRVDRSQVTTLSEESPELEPKVDHIDEPVAHETVITTIQRVEEVSEKEAGVSRRMFFTRALVASMGAFAGLLGFGILSYLWPNLRGGFGSDIDIGDVDEVRQKIFQPDGSILPLFVPSARTYIVPIDEAAVADSRFAGLNVVDGGLMALFQRCVHLGCRVPWCPSSQGFECPCHGSKYNAVGEYEAGPAPRNLDRFVVEVRSNRFVVRTGLIIETPKDPDKTVAYPQGPSCISVEGGEA